jgi:hypothetical protein
MWPCTGSFGWGWVVKSSESGVWNSAIVAYTCDPAQEVLDEVE